MIIASQIPLTVVAGTPDTSGVPSLLLTVPQISREDADTLVTRCSLQPQCVPGAARPDGDRGDEHSGGCAHLSDTIELDEAPEQILRHTAINSPHCRSYITLMVF